MPVDDAVRLMRMEFVEFPELKLTFWQAQRLWRLSEDECAAALKRLLESRFLTRTVGGAYVRGDLDPALIAPAGRVRSQGAFA